MIRNRLFNTKLLVVGLLLLISSSCVKFPTPGPGPEPGTTIPTDFNWKTVHDVNINVQVPSVSGIGDNYIRVIRIYSSPMLKDGSLVVSGAAKPGSPLVVKLTLPTALSSIYVQEILPTGKRTVQKVEISSQQLNITINNSSAIAQPLQKIATKASFTSPSIPIPANYDVTLGATGSTTILGFGSGQSSAYGNTYKSYYIPAGITRTASTNMSNYLGHAILYVKGTLNLSSSTMSLNKSSIVILDGGSVIVKGLGTGVFDANIPIVYLQQNTNLTSSGIVEFNDGITIVNKGTISIVKDMKMNVASTFYNEGSLTITDSKSGVFITNSSTLYNSGIINTPKFNITTNASVVNDPSGKITAKTYYQTNGTVMDNFNEIVATTSLKTDGGATINNYCNIAANLTDLQGTIGNLFEGSLWESQTFKINNTTMNMNGSSMFLTGNITDVYGMNLLSSSGTYSVFKCTGNVPDLRYAASQVNGKIEFVHTNLVIGSSGTNGSLLYEALFNNNGSILSKVQTKNILASTCNDAAGQIEDPAPEIIDNDEDGVAAEFDYDDNDPNVAFVSYFPTETTWGTFAFEDLWPWKGDYDMNDLVLGFRVKLYSNSENKVTSMDFDYNIRAAGSSLILSAAFQLDKVNASNVTSVTGEPVLGTAPFGVGSNGTESGVNLAVIPLFNKVRDIVTEEYLSFLNTLPDSYITTPDKSVKIIFANPVNLSDLNMSSINFFVITNNLGETNRGKEIHLPTFLHTTKADVSYFAGKQLHPTDKYKFDDGMMWGIMIPETFNYPLEFQAVDLAYLHFNEWALSGGVDFNDWYKNLSGYRDDTKIFTY
ncbi:MAG: Outer membrane protein [uncultured bacterium]|nr:MAG: Outer membrane protein [uncultured bacterium]